MVGIGDQPSGPNEGRLSGSILGGKKACGAIWRSPESGKALARVLAGSQIHDRTEYTRIWSTVALCCLVRLD